MTLITNFIRCFSKQINNIKYIKDKDKFYFYILFYLKIGVDYILT